jgi:hypothetical protein
MFKNKIALVVFTVLISAIVLVLVFEIKTKPPLAEKKVGEIVRSKDFLLGVLKVHSALDRVTRINLVIRNLSDKPIKFLVTDRSDKSDDLGYKKYYFIVEQNKKIYLTCCANHLVDPDDKSGKSDYVFDIYFSGYITPSDNYFLLVAEDPLGEEVVSKIKLTTNQ